LALQTALIDPIEHDVYIALHASTHDVLAHVVTEILPK